LIWFNSFIFAQPEQAIVPAVFISARDNQTFCKKVIAHGNAVAIIRVRFSLDEGGNS
jgi:hypothetical protein